MNGLVVFDTSYGNTRILAEAIAGALQATGIETDTLHVKKVKKLRAEDYNFIVIGSPTRLGTMSLTVKGFLGRFNDKAWTGKPFAVFDTELSENIEMQEGSAAEKIAGKLKEEQMKQLLPVLKAVVLGRKGPLQEGEIERAKEYALKIAAELRGL